MKKNNIIIVGYGSIGKRHARNLKSLPDCNIILLRRSRENKQNEFEEIFSLKDILKYEPLFVIISNPTKYHFRILSFCIYNNLNFLCEKPLLSSNYQIKKIKKISLEYKGIGRVAYNMRYHPIIIKIKDLIKSKKLKDILYCRFFVGQYLPSWRPKTNHLKNYSSFNKLGGGVVFDLSHELDLAEYFFGSIKKEIKNHVYKVSNVTVDSEDIAEIIYKNKSDKLISLHLNYLIRKSTRKIFIFTQDGVLKADLLKAKIKIFKGQKLIEKISYKDFKRNHMYLDLILDFYSDLSRKKNKSKLPLFLDNLSLNKDLLRIKS